jgi:hypothetical protein
MNFLNGVQNSVSEKWRSVKQGYVTSCLSVAERIAPFQASISLLDILRYQKWPVECHGKYILEPLYQRKFFLFPPTENIYFVNDFALMQTVLRKARNGEEFSLTGEEEVILRTGEKNILSCPFAQHRRLRAPQEKLFSMRQLQATQIPRELVLCYWKLVTNTKEKDYSDPPLNALAIFLGISLMIQSGAVSFLPSTHKNGVRLAIVLRRSMQKNNMPKEED